MAFWYATPSGAKTATTPATIGVNKAKEVDVNAIAPLASNATDLKTINASVRAFTVAIAVFISSDFIASIKSFVY